MRTYPKESKNPVADLVYWFYQYKWGVKPDSSMYARHSNKKNPKALCHLMVANKEYDAEVYTAQQLAELVYYLEDRDVTVDDLSIVTISGLAASFINRDRSPAAKSELERVIVYLKGNNKNNDEQQQDSRIRTPRGW
jgi:hypothetical protein